MLNMRCPFRLTLSLLILPALTAVCHLATPACLIADDGAEKDLPPALQAWLGPQTWVHDTLEPVISLGKTGEFDDTHLLSPLVARIDDRFAMWYAGSRGTVDERSFRLGFASSRDGRSFTKGADNPVFSFGDDKHSVLTPTMLRNTDGTPIREDGKLRLWFSATDFDVSPLHTLHEVTSTDGRNWSNPSPAQLEGVYAPTILKGGDKYHLWYTDVSDEPWVVRHAESPDGRNWKVTEKPVLTIDQDWEQSRMFYPHVVKVDDVYLMWYGSYWARRQHTTAIGFAVSVDGITWHKHPDNPVLTPREEVAWESHYTTSGSAVRLDDGVWRMWFATRKKPPFVNKYFAIGTATWAGPKATSSTDRHSDKQSQRESTVSRRILFTALQQQAKKVDSPTGVEEARFPAPDPPR
jgi:hypothetical protein